MIFALALALSVGLAFPAVARDCATALSAGSPPVKARHIFCGEINHAGKAVGFHSRPGGKNPTTVSDTAEIRADKRHPGLYTISRFRIADDGKTAIKTLSSMFPDRCSEQDVIAAIQHAYNTGTKGDGAFDGLSGPSCADGNGKPFRIHGFTGVVGNRTVIVTGYPN